MEVLYIIFSFFWRMIENFHSKKISAFPLKVLWPWVEHLISLYSGFLNSKAGIAVLCGLNGKGSGHSAGPATEQAFNNYRLSLVTCMDMNRGNIFQSLTLSLLVWVPFWSLSQPYVMKNEIVYRQMLKLMLNSNWI